MTYSSYSESTRQFGEEMMTTIVSIKAIRNGKAMVEADAQKGCGSCEMTKGCGTKALSSVMAKPLPVMSITNDFNGNVGDEIEIGIPQASLMKGAMLVYLFPLAGMLMGALLGAEISVENSFALILGVAGFIFGAIYARVFMRSERFARSLQPVFIRKSPNHSV